MYSKKLRSSSGDTYVDKLGACCAWAAYIGLGYFFAPKAMPILATILVMVLVMAIIANAAKGPPSGRA
jgi:hypothetical protein